LPQRSPTAARTAQDTGSESGIRKTEGLAAVRVDGSVLPLATLRRILYPQCALQGRTHLLAVLRG
jgi:hypothetical protein